MRVVLDTNVLMSGIFFSGPPAMILAAWSEGRLDLLATVEILAEYRRVAKRLAKQYPSIEVDPVLDLVIRVRVRGDRGSDASKLRDAVSGRVRSTGSGVYLGVHNPRTVEHSS